MYEWRPANTSLSIAAVFRAHFRRAAAYAFRWLSLPFRWLPRLLWHGLRHLSIWIVTKSPLAEPRRSAHRPLLRLLPWIVVAIAWIALTLAVFGVYYSSVLPDPRVAGTFKFAPSLTIVARGGELIAERGMRRDYVRFDDMPAYLVKAVIATEDRRFFYHFGFDPAGLLRAAAANWRSGEVVQGGSTITQQLAKNLFLRPARDWRRKVEEFILALWLETRFTKKQILELYLNRVYFGAGNYGVGAAAWHYFRKPVKDLSLSEAALLVGLIKAPSYYSPSANLDRARKRASEILKVLAEDDTIDINQYAEALAHPAQIKAAPSTPGFGYIADWVAEEAPMLTGETDHNLIVETTIDAKLQRSAIAAVESVIRAKGRKARVSEAALLLMTPDGAIRAMVGGRNYADSQFNRVMRALRQPGSAFKPFIYLTAIENGYTPESLVEDSPVDIDGWRPENFDRNYRGQITLRAALTHSSNLAAVRLMQALGAPKVLETAHRIGVRSVKDVGPTLALGTSETTLLEMTSAFAVFANGGFSVAPEMVERIRDDTGRVLFERAKGPLPRVVSQRAISTMNDMLNAVVAGGTGQAAVLPFHPAAGKTGTSQNFKDAWFIGYTAHWVGGVWMGNDDARPMRGVTGGSLPAEIWKSVMVTAHEGLAAKALPGTELNPALLQAAAEAEGLADVPARNPFREKLSEAGAQATAEEEAAQTN